MEVGPFVRPTERGDQHRPGLAHGRHRAVDGLDLTAQPLACRLARGEPAVIGEARQQTLDGLRAEFARLGSVIAGEQSPREDYRAAVTELREALDAHPEELVGFASVPLGLDSRATGAWLDEQLSRPGIVGIGELTPAPDRARAIEPALAVSADHGGLPVLVHGFAPNTVGDLRTYAALAARFPQVPVIVGAFGGLNWMELVDLALERPNLYIDLSSALQVFAVRMAARVLPEQCLFGSNTPCGDVLATRVMVDAPQAQDSALDRSGPYTKCRTSAVVAAATSTTTRNGARSRTAVKAASTPADRASRVNRWLLEKV
ncbi:putative TIM-barrel fold metal-dependent hydrolase [Kitasatospora sp. GP82]|nr:putative TIM-barrel fold metal-dependent hydrolase [Kitasatospora sp. GP82]